MSDAAWGDWSDEDWGWDDEGEDGSDGVSAFLMRVHTLGVKGKTTSFIVYTWNIEHAMVCGEVLSAVYL